MMIGEDPDELGQYTSPSASCMRSTASAPAGRLATAPFASTGALNGVDDPVARLLPDRPLPPYAYLPGRFPHPVRDPRGHSYKANVAPTMKPGEADPDAMRLGADLFNQGFYWEAHEAWEDLWRCSPKHGPDHLLLHGLILLAAAGIKIREGKEEAARRHGARAVSYFRRSGDASMSGIVASLGWSSSSLAVKVDKVMTMPFRGANDPIAFDFALG